MLFILLGIAGSLFIEPIVYFSLIAIFDIYDKKEVYISYKSELMVVIHVVEIIAAVIISFTGILVHLGMGTPTAFSYGYIIGFAIQAVGMFIFFRSFIGRIIFMCLHLIMLQDTIDKMEKGGCKSKEMSLYKERIDSIKSTVSNVLFDDLDKRIRNTEKRVEKF